MVNDSTTNPTTPDHATTLLDGLERDLSRRFGRDEPWEALEFLLSSLRSGVASGDWSQGSARELIDCVEDILEGQLVSPRTTV